jgi:hypothetical protein
VFDMLSRGTVFSMDRFRAASQSRDRASQTSNSSPSGPSSERSHGMRTRRASRAVDREPEVRPRARDDGTPVPCSATCSLDALPLSPAPGDNGRAPGDVARHAEADTRVSNEFLAAWVSRPSPSPREA